MFIFKNPPKVLNSINSLKLINKNELSISRYGDGEFSIINKKSIKFQDYNSELARRLEEILFVEEKTIYPCIP